MDFKLFFTPDEGGQARGMQRVEPALRRVRAQRRPRPHLPGNALEIF
jgi:hypothetical protein